MKIFFVVTQSEFGGAQRYVFEAARYLSSQGYEIVVAAGQGDGELIKKFSIFKPIKIISLKHLRRVPGPITALLSLKEILKFLKKERPDALFLCSTVAGILGSIAAKVYCSMFHVPCSMKVIYRIGGFAFRDPRPAWQNKILVWLEKLTARLKDKIIVNCEIDRELAIEYKIAPAEKIVKIYNGVDVNTLNFLSSEEARRYLNQELRIKNQENKKFDFLRTCVKSQIKIVGTVANFYKTKGLEYLIKSAHILSLELNAHSLKFIIVGDGPLRPQLQALIKKYGLENTVFLVGRIPNAYRFLSAFDIFVLPSLKEGFPWIILETMAAQIPIIATKVGAIPEILEQSRDGMLVEPKSSHELAEKIARLLKHPSEALQMASLARKKTETLFTLQKMLAKTENILQ